jgi:hypothetical protein
MQTGCALMQCMPEDGVERCNVLALCRALKPSSGQGMAFRGCHTSINKDESHAHHLPIHTLHALLECIRSPTVHCHLCAYAHMHEHSY